jgi:hypothetical protein
MVQLRSMHVNFVRESQVLLEQHPKTVFVDYIRQDVC